MLFNNIIFICGVVFLSTTTTNVLALPIIGDVLGSADPTQNLTGAVPPVGGNLTDPLTGLPLPSIPTNTDLLNGLPIGDLPASDILNGGLLDSLKIGDLLKLGNLVKCEKTLKLLRIQIDVGIPLD